MIMNVADVKKTLAAAIQLNYAGNRVVLDLDDSYIENKSSGEITPIKIENGEYVFDLWVPAAPANQPPIKLEGNQFAALITDDEEIDESFHRQDA